MNTSGSLLVRADAGGLIGAGHVMRCLALCQGWIRRGGRAAILSRGLPPTLDGRLQREAFAIRHSPGDPQESGGEDDLAETLAVARSLDASWVVLDGYRFGFDFQSGVRCTGQRVLVLDDHGYSDTWAADVILNQNIGVTADLYRGTTGGARILLGTRYALLRDDYLAWSEWRHPAPDRARRLLVALGAGDSTVALEKVLEALASIDEEVEVRVVAATHEGHRAATPVKYLGFVEDLATELAAADIAITAAGSTVWEMAYMGVPMITFALADNQHGIAFGLEQAGVAVALGDLSNVTEERLSSVLPQLMASRERRAVMSERGRDLVDGRGVDRVIRALLTHEVVGEA